MNGIAKPMLEYMAQAPAGSTVFAVIIRPGGDRDTEVIRRVPAGSVHWVEERRAFDWRVIGGLRRAIRDSGAGVIVSNGAKSHLLARMARPPESAPHWVAFHHGYTMTDRKVQFYNEVGQWMLRSAPRVLTVCDAFARDLHSRGVPLARIRVVRLPVRSGGAVRRVAVDGPKVLVTAGRLSREKGHADLVEAIALLRRKELRVFVLGSGVEMARLRGLIAERGLTDTVELCGYRNDVRDYLARADVFVLPSYSEGSPNALLEAMDAGAPVVATAVGGVPEIVTDGVHALLTPPGRPAELARAIGRILDEPGLGDRLAEAARQVARERTPEAFYREMTASLQP